MASLHLLVVAADGERRALVADALRAAGHQVMSVEDGASAAEALREPGFDLVAIDPRLPALDGEGLRRSLAPVAPVAPDSLEAAERRHIAHVLAHTGGNKRQAALLLGISRSTLLHKVRKYGLEASRRPDPHTS